MGEQAGAEGDSTKERIILNAALDVFVERGWNGARMQEIADRAGINKALLHYYFRSKENIYDRIVETVFKTFFTGIDTALKDDMPFDVVIRQFINTIVDGIGANPRIPQFVMHELSLGGKNVMKILTRIVDDYGLTLPQRMFALIKREVAAGRIRPVDPPQLMITLLGACIYYFAAEPIVGTLLSHVVPDVEYDRQEFIAARKEQIFDVVYYGLKKRSDEDEA